MRSPIGIFDSGLGGLSVAREVIRKLPQERIIYFADTAHVPYGERPLEEIKGFALDITRFLIERGAKAVVMACNMSSAVALDEARTRWPDVPILGVVEPGAKVAVRTCDGRPIGVLATTGTVKSEAYARAVGRFDDNIVVVQQACPKFVPLVEAGLADSEEAEAVSRDYVAPLIQAGCGTIILGCTHYPFLRRAIESATGPGISIVDPAEETVLELAKVLNEKGIASDAFEGSHLFYASGETSGFAELGSRFLGEPIERVISLQASVVCVRTHGS
ncbi:MAG: glutamate racemase [Armatimonadetes bacterium]|nr:glutamate racemase [Armatimonadota bacterium]